jgi:hypothetical protein
MLLQQSAFVEQASPRAALQRLVVAPGVPQCPEQHSLSAVQCRVEAGSVLMQHVPAVQVWPPQQDAVWLQALPACPHSHRPLVHKPLQHSDALVHALGALPQQAPQAGAAIGAGAGGRARAPERDAAGGARVADRPRSNPASGAARRAIGDPAAAAAVAASPSQQVAAAAGLPRSAAVALALSHLAFPQQPELLLDTEQACRFAMQAPRRYLAGGGLQH